MTRRPYVRPLHPHWWLRDRRQFLYIVREGTSVFVGLYSAILMDGLIRLAQGREAWETYLAALSSPLGVTVQVICLAFAAFHAVTWFGVTPKAMPPLLVKGEPIPARTIVRGHFILWAVLSLAVLLVLGG
jgi:fumarate reductase subunit C